MEPDNLWVSYPGLWGLTVERDGHCHHLGEYRFEYRSSQLASQLLFDAIVTISIAVCLFKSRTGWSHTDAVLSRLIV
jgi:hypothetical protein